MLPIVLEYKAPCPQWDELTKLISGSATMTEVSLSNPCGTDFVMRKLAWVVTVFKYRPFVGYVGEDVIKVRHILRFSMNS